MLFLDDFLEMLEELPMELRERCTDIREIDLQIAAGVDRIHKAMKQFFESGEGTAEQKELRIKQFQEEYRKLRQKAEEKVEIAEKMQELLEKYTQHLEKEKTHFKYELEADNPGVTEAIEKRFAEYVESMMLARKERKKRHHVKSNGANVDGEPANKIIRLDSILPLEEEHLPPVPLTRRESTPMQRKMSATPEESSSPAPMGRRVQPSLSVPTSNGAPMFADRSDRWTPSSSSPLPQSPSLSHHSSPAPFSFNPSMTPSTSMPNFTGLESRHGRPRKLTSRVQEMFKETMQRHERRHPPPVAEEEEERTRSSHPESDEAGEDTRTWCICGQKSYGHMVACDNRECPFEWFHYHCVGIEASPRGKWFCPHCADKVRRGSGASLLAL